MPATGLKIVGMGHVYHGVKTVQNIQNSLKTSGHQGQLWVFEVLVLEFGPVLAWYRFPAAEVFVVVIDVFFV